MQIFKLNFYIYNHTTVRLDWPNYLSHCHSMMFCRGSLWYCKRSSIWDSDDKTLDHLQEDPFRPISNLLACYSSKVISDSSSTQFTSCLTKKRSIKVILLPMKHSAVTEEGMGGEKKGKETVLKYMKRKREPKMERETLLKLPFLGFKKKKIISNFQQWLADHLPGSQ